MRAKTINAIVRAIKAGHETPDAIARALGEGEPWVARHLAAMVASGRIVESAPLRFRVY